MLKLNSLDTLRSIYSGRFLLKYIRIEGLISTNYRLLNKAYYTSISLLRLREDKYFLRYLPLVISKSFKSLVFSSYKDIASYI